jgi:hypothetical protein
VVWVTRIVRQINLVYRAILFTRNTATLKRECRANEIAFREGVAVKGHCFPAFEESDDELLVRRFGDLPHAAVGVFDKKPNHFGLAGGFYGFGARRLSLYCGGNKTERRQEPVFPSIHSRSKCLPSFGLRTTQ